MHKRTGFTLIELLVVMAIIALLSSVVLATLATARMKSRDARRAADIRQIYTALNLYYDTYGCLPITNGSSCGLASSTTFSNAGGWDYSSQTDFLPFLSTGTSPFMTKVPVDPINNMTGDNAPAGTYAYRYYCYVTDPKGPQLAYWKELPVRNMIAITESTLGNNNPDFICR